MEESAFFASFGTSSSDKERQARKNESNKITSKIKKNAAILAYLW